MFEQLVDGQLTKLTSYNYEGVLPFTNGRMTASIVGEGNGQETTIRVEGEQFPFTEYKKLERGFELTLVGEQELLDLIAGLTKIHTLVRGNTDDAN